MTDCRVEESSGYAKEYPSVDHQAKAKYEGDVEEHSRIKTCCSTRSRILVVVNRIYVGDLSAAECEEEEPIDDMRIFSSGKDDRGECTL